MSIASTDRRAGPYQTDGAQVAFPFEFAVFADTDLVVVEYFGDGTYNTLQLDTDYTVTLNDDQDSDPGGTVTTVDEHDDTDIVITTDLPIEQPTVFTNTGGFYPRVMNRALDRLTIIAQQINEGLKRSFRVSMLEEEITPLNATAAERANKFVVFDATGLALGFSNGTGADDGLREDLAENGNDLVRVSYPGFGAIVSTLGDMLPTVAASTFFGIRSNGATDDTDAWNAAIEAMEHSTNPNGRTIFNEPGQPSIITGGVVIRPGVTVDLRGGSFDAQFNGGVDPGVHMMSRSGLRGGTVSVTSTAPGGTQSAVHAPIFLGVLQGNSGPANAISEYATVNGARVENVRLLSTRSGGIAIVIFGDVYSCEFDGITIPDSALMAGAVTLDWNLHGETVYDGDTVQGIWSDDDRQQLNKDAYDAWLLDDTTGAYTVHPHCNRFRNFVIGSLTKAYTGSIDTGSFAARVSGGYGNVFENFHVDLTTEGSIIHHAGDLGFEFARPEDLHEALRGNRFRNFTIRSAYRGYAIKHDSFADNIDDATTTNQRLDDGTLSGSSYTPVYPAMYKTDAIYENIRAYTGEGDNALQGVLAQNATGGTFIDCVMRGFTNNWRFDNAHDIDVVRLSSRYAREHGIKVEGASSYLRFTDTKEAEYSGQKAANTYDEINIGASSFVDITRGTFGADTNAPSQRSCIRSGNSGDGVTYLSLHGPIRLMSNGAASAALKIGGANDDQTLAWEINGGIRYGGNVTSKSDGLVTIPVSRKVDSGGNTITEWETIKAATLANYVVFQSDRFWLRNAVSGEPAVRVAVGSGTIDGTGSDRDTFTETLGVLS